jgi:hypothetical protein
MLSRSKTLQEESSLCGRAEKLKAEKYGRLRMYAKSESGTRALVLESDQRMVLAILLDFAHECLLGRLIRWHRDS